LRTTGPGLGCWRRRTSRAAARSADMRRGVIRSVVEVAELGGSFAHAVVGRQLRPTANAQTIAHGRLAGRTNLVITLTPKRQLEVATRLSARTRSSGAEYKLITPSLVPFTGFQV
jgi:hypothetical protein